MVNSVKIITEKTNDIVRNINDIKKSKLFLIQRFIFSKISLPITLIISKILILIISFLILIQFSVYLLYNIDIFLDERGGRNFEII